MEKCTVFWEKGKLSPRYVGPFEILERISLVAYLLRLPEELADVHGTFCVSNLKKCLVKDRLHVSLGGLKIDKTLISVKKPVEIKDRGWNDVVEIRKFVSNFP
ncbi:hypothetical protein Tco_0805055 [Tanacetum coccineum]